MICLSISLKHIILDNWVSFSTDRRFEIRISLVGGDERVGDSLVDYIRNNGPKLNSLVLRSLSSSIALITKLSWISDRRHRSLLDSIESIIDMGPAYSIIGFDMMSDFVEQMNLPNTSRCEASCSSLVDSTEHRRTATQFISENLLDIFEYALSILRQIHNGDQQYSDPSYRVAVLQSISSIISRCLQFDFQGCTGDEGSDEVWVLQLPVTWEGLVCNSNMLRMLFDMWASHVTMTPSYMSVDVPLTKSILELIMLFASVRRSLFRDGTARLEFLNVLIQGVQKCLETGYGLNDEDTYNMMCQLLSRLKVDFFPFTQV